MEDEGFEVQSTVSEPLPPPPHRCSPVDGRKTSVNVSLALDPVAAGNSVSLQSKKKKKRGPRGGWELRLEVKSVDTTALLLLPFHFFAAAEKVKVL